MGDILIVLKKVGVSGDVAGVDWRRPVKGLNAIEEAMGGVECGECGEIGRAHV